MREIIVKKLRELKEQGLDAYRAVQALKRELRQPLPPTRYEVAGDVYGGRYLVAVLEKNGEVVDRVKLSREGLRELGGLLGLEEGRWYEGRELEALANALPPEKRPPVEFYPFAEEEALGIIQAIEEVVWTDREDYRGSLLGCVIGVAWKE